MAEEVETKEHIVRLSSIDQASERTYIGYCLCFPCNEEDVDSIITRLASTVNRTAAHLPALAGYVRPVKDNNYGPKGRLEIAVTLKQVQDFLPSIEIFTAEGFQDTYQDLHKAGMPVTALLSAQLTPLPNVPDVGSAPVFAVQANFISGGVLVTLYLHHSAADSIGLRTIIRSLSSDLPAANLTDDDLYEKTLEQSRLRDRLSGSRGTKPILPPSLRAETNLVAAAEAAADSESSSRSPTQQDCRRVLSFNLALIEGSQRLANERFHYIRSDQVTHLSTFDILTAILWKGVTRALLQASALSQKAGTPYMSSLSMPVNIRKSVEPALDDDYFGNASIPAIAMSEAVKLTVPFDAGALAEIARLGCIAMQMVSEQQVRTTIAGINGRANVQSTPNKSFSTTGNLVILDWTDLLLEDAELGLGLGAPRWGRKLGRAAGADGCVVHPVRRQEGVWEVTMEFTEAIMNALLQDEGFMAYVSHVA